MPIWTAHCEVHHELNDLLNTGTKNLEPTGVPVSLSLSKGCLTEL
jgi:hypothetical protein